MNILLFSNGKVSGNETLLQFGLDWIEAAVKRTGAKRFLFIPYAMIRGNYDDRLAQLEQVLSHSVHKSQVFITQKIRSKLLKKPMPLL
ncbi:hypothetical protein P780_08590 [Vibrio mimicus CAIM 1882]|nr:hypothetical protein P780_08590 [Vibrio mimicus CAIM 1882]